MAILGINQKGLKISKGVIMLNDLNARQLAFILTGVNVLTAQKLRALGDDHYSLLKREAASTQVMAKKIALTQEMQLSAQT